MNRYCPGVTTPLSGPFFYYLPAWLTKSSCSTLSKLESSKGWGKESVGSWVCIQEPCYLRGGMPKRKQVGLVARQRGLITAGALQAFGAGWCGPSYQHGRGTSQRSKCCLMGWQRGAPQESGKRGGSGKGTPKGIRKSWSWKEQPFPQDLGRFGAAEKESPTGGRWTW